MKKTFLPLYVHLLLAVLTVLTILLCICVGSVAVPLDKTVDVLLRALQGLPQETSATVSIILYTRLPRVLCVALLGAMLSLGGCAMQGLLRNPLADGSTLGVSSGASLGAAIAILSGISIPFLPFSGTAGMAMVSAFVSLAAILALSYALDRSLSTNTLILLGVVFSMFVSAVLSLLITFSGEKLRSITFWTMGSLSSASYENALALLCTLVVCGTILLLHADALNAMSMGEEYALHVGVPVRRVKLTVMICVCAMTGMCVSIGGGIGFVGLVMPHMARMIVGANHRRTLPASLYGGAIFLLLADLLARTIVAPAVLPVGVVTAIIGAFAFLIIFLQSRRRQSA